MWGLQPSITEILTIARFNADSLHCRKDKNGKWKIWKKKNHIQPMNIQSLNQIEEANEVGANCVDFSPFSFVRFPILISYHLLHIFTVQSWGTDNSYTHTQCILHMYRPKTRWCQAEMQLHNLYLNNIIVVLIQYVNVPLSLEGIQRFIVGSSIVTAMLETVDSLKKKKQKTHSND